MKGAWQAEVRSKGKRKEHALLPSSSQWVITPAAADHAGLCGLPATQAWQTEEEKYEAEEVMKIINERKPADL